MIKRTFVVKVLQGQKRPHSAMVRLNIFYLENFFGAQSIFWMSFQLKREEGSLWLCFTTYRLFSDFIVFKGAPYNYLEIGMEEIEKKKIKGPSGKRSTRASSMNKTLAYTKKGLHQARVFLSSMCTPDYLVNHYRYHLYAWANLVYTLARLGTWMSVCLWVCTCCKPPAEVPICILCIFTN